MVGPRNRLVRHKAEQAATHFRQPLPRPSGVRHQPPEHELGHSSVSVPLPSITHPSSGVAESEAVQ